MAPPPQSNGGSYAPSAGSSRPGSAYVTDSKADLVSMELSEAGRQVNT